MAKNIIALMFPEYNDIGNPVTSKDWVVDELYDDKTFGVQIKETGMFVDFFNDEECNMIYDSMNLNAYLYAVNVLPECYPSRIRQLRSIFKQYGLKIGVKIVYLLKQKNTALTMRQLKMKSEQK